MIRQIVELANKKGYVIHRTPFKLNIWGFRSKSAKPNSFDDEIHVFTNVSATAKPNWLYMVMKCTTDPSTYWLQNPMNKDGTVILNAGQYKDAYQLGMHKGKYKALVQRGKVSVTRDYNKDAILDFYNGKKYWGYFGINIHRASAKGSALYVDKDSAGCQVLKNRNDYEKFIKLCEFSQKIHGNKFTYTLIDLRQENKDLINEIVLGSMIVGFVIGSVYLITLKDEYE